ncbi:MAG: phosphodiester glycosidase family protein [Clostridia bacterium]|nr:phosphodiester glycosidase family protein [Clostridia bacterium]
MKILKIALCLLLIVSLVGCKETDRQAAEASPSPVETAAPTASLTPTPEPTLSPEQLLEQRLAELEQGFEDSRNELAAGAWYTAEGGETPSFWGDSLYSTAAAPVQAEAVYGGLFSFGYINDGKVSMIGSGLGSREQIEAETDVAGLAIGANHLLLMHGDGTVTGYGNLTFGKCDTQDWAGIVEVEAGVWHSVGRTHNMHAVAVGSNDYGQCEVDGWSALIDIAAGLHHTVGLRYNGTVVAVGDNSYGQCEVEEWTDIIAVYCGANYTVGLKSDYTLIACGDNANGQCEVGGFTDVIAAACGAWHTVVKTADGELHYVGANTNGQFGAEAELVSAGEYIYGTETEAGPWFYLSQVGGIAICYDTTLEKSPLRADLFCTYGHLPYGAFAAQDFTMKTTALPAKIARQNDAVFAQTGDYIGHRGNRKGVMIRQGQLLYDENKTSTMAFFPDGTMRVFFQEEAITAEELLAEGVSDSFSFWPVLIKDGAFTDNLMEYSEYRPTSRSAIGMAEPYHFISVVTHCQYGMTYIDLAQQFLDYGCTVAYNLDGGNSTSMVFMGESISRVRYNYNEMIGQRSVSDVLMFCTSEAVPDENDPYLQEPVVNAPR